MLNIIIVGINGQIGKFVYDSAKKNNINVVCGVDKNIVGEFDCPVFRSFDEVKNDADVIIDFSIPEMITEVLGFAKENKCAVVIGTTGYDEMQEEYISAMAQYIPIFKSSNMSLGVNLVLKLCCQAAKTLKDFDVEIIDKHHNRKLDAPSGTTILIADAIKNAVKEEREYVYGRKGKGRRQKSEIGIHSVRGGTLVGEHDILFLGNNESVTITHTAYSKELFADGAIKAAEFIEKKPKGFYDMNDLLKS